MMIYVITEQLCRNSEYSDELYGDWYRSMDCRVLGVSLEKPRVDYDQEYDAFELGECEVNAGDVINVITMHYSTGDSFGREDGCMEVIWATPSLSEATNIVKAVREHQDEFSIKFTLENGKEIQLSNPGAGYFESVDYIEVEGFTVNGPGIKMRF